MESIIMNPAYLLRTVSALLVIALVTHSCSSSVSTPEVNEEPVVASQKGVSVQGAGNAGPELVIYDPKSGTITPNKMDLRINDKVGVVVLGNGKLDVRKIDASKARLAGAQPLDVVPHTISIFLTTSVGERVRNQPYYDYNNDGHDDLVLAFRALDLAPSSSSNRFTVEIDGIAAGAKWDYTASNTPWAGTYWPTLKSALGKSDAIVSLDVSTNTFSPTKVTLMPGEEIAIILYNGHAGYDSKVVSSATLNGAPEKHASFFDTHNKAAGVRKARQHTVAFSKKNNDSYGTVLHFDLDAMEKTPTNAFKVEINGQFVPFFTNYRPQVKGGGVELGFGK